MKKKLSLFLSALAIASGAYSQTVQVKDTVMVTYPYSAPDPIPNPGTLYPYFKFRQFTDEAERKSWKMVVLENDYLRVKIFPEIGGKVWSIYDKTAGKEMFYDNDAVKFREIAMRGPWTSGGIEFNYGVIGHAPTCASPVDWKTEEKEDGSVSCYISANELLSRSRWTIEINLPKDAVWVRTTSVWHNGSSEYQPYYSWANSGVKTTEDMRLLYPAENAIGHVGEHLTYPVNEKGSDISWYRNQGYGADKSYHMTGSQKPFFGAYYTSEDWGVMHYSRRDEKLGRKYFCWAQSEQGNIWVDLLTDGRPQYIEMQSGRLFNQNVIECSQNSAYRQILFTPYGTDRWSDYWLPFGGIGPADDVNLNAVVSVSEKNGKTRFSLYPLQELSGELVLSDADGKVIKSSAVNLKPAKPFTIEVKGSPSKLKVGDKLVWRAEDGKIDRPQKNNPEFDRSSTVERLLMARDLMGMKFYREAEAKVDSVLDKEPGNIRALDMKGSLLFRRMKYKEAYACSDKALSIDQYDPEAGYVGGLAAAHTGKLADALDRLEVAAISDSPLRGACYTELARLHFIRDDKDLAADYARKALGANAGNLTAAFILYKATGEGPEALGECNPLGHFAEAELFLKGKLSADAFSRSFKAEMPWQDCLEVAVRYCSLELDTEAASLLEALPVQNILTSLWIAYLKKDKNLIPDAERQSIDFVFPFRSESAPVLRWAIENGGGWKSEYLMAMLQDSFGYSDAAEALLRNDKTGYAPYHAYRYKFTKDTEDLRKACKLQPDSWLYLRKLAEDLLEKGQSDEAIPMLANYYEANPKCMQIGDILIDAYIKQNRFHEAEAIIDKIVYLPFEGQHGSHDKYRMIKNRLAAEAIDAGDYDRAERLVAEARLWPTRLGTGKPYDELIDSSTEDWLESEIKARRSGSGPFDPVTPRL